MPKWTSLGDSYRVEIKIVADEMQTGIVVPIGAWRGDASQAGAWKRRR
jgi:hypothetical protein